VAVSFSYDNFVSLFPELSAVQPDQVQVYWNAAFAWFDNTGWPGTLPIAQLALNFLAAHLIWLFSMRDPNGNPSTTGGVMPPSLVGRINSASEGSVSVGTEWGSGGMPAAPSEPWFLQTRYGAAFWTMTAPWRTAVYIPPHTPPVGPNPWYPAMLPPWPTW
jgi:hypothetical protein